MDSFIEATNAGVGSAVSKVVVYPLDLIKTRMATTGESFGDTVEKLQEEGGGPQGLYRGIGPKVFKSVTGKFFYFYLYSSLSKARLAFSSDDTKSLDTFSNLVIGFFSEVFELPLIMPLEAIVSRVQASKDPNTSAVKEATAMYKEGNGMSKFYVGLDSYVLGALQPAIQMSVYDQVRPMILRNRKGDLSALEAFCLGSVASSIAVTATYPMDVCRTLAQTAGEGEKQKNLLEAMQHIVKTEGVSALFRGLSAQLFQSVLSSAIMLVVKERIKRYTTRLLLIILTAIGLRARRSVTK
mmetsp:Transcript_10862/g.20113  ORF Transcript_10862/g.20113 Transcript_10862/m.20113 type:complete len:297 (+) Transcript_10862:84-974(+)